MRSFVPDGSKRYPVNDAALLATVHLPVRPKNNALFVSSDDIWLNGAELKSSFRASADLKSSGELKCIMLILNKLQWRTVTSCLLPPAFNDRIQEMPAVADPGSLFKASRRRGRAELKH